MASQKVLDALVERAISIHGGKRMKAGFRRMLVLAEEPSFLDYEKLLASDIADFMFDMLGLVQHFNEKTGTIKNGTPFRNVRSI